MTPPVAANAKADADESALLRAFLHNRSHPCPVCGYDLRDLLTDRCPECGRVLRLTLSEISPAYAPFIAGLIAFAAPAGAAATGVVGVVYVHFAYSVSWSNYLRPLVVNAVVLTVTVPALAAWIRAARTLRRQTPGRQWTLAVLAWAATLVGFGICLAVG